MFSAKMSHAMSCAWREFPADLGSGSANFAEKGGHCIYLSVSPLRTTLGGCGGDRVRIAGDLGRKMISCPLRLRGWGPSEIPEEPLGEPPRPRLPRGNGGARCLSQKSRIAAANLYNSSALSSSAPCGSHSSITSGWFSRGALWCTLTWCYSM